MAKTDFKSIDEYIATFPEDVRAVLETVRNAIKRAVPDAEEVISYQIPALKYHGFVCYFSAHKNHFSLSCPPPTGVYEAFSEQLARYRVTKSAINFPFSEPVPETLIEAIAAFRAQENVEKEQARAAAKGKK